MKSTPPSLYATVTNAIIEEMEQGAVPWVKPWKNRASIPYNAVSQKEYSGMNVLLLWRYAFLYGYTTPAWATIRQINELGGRVKKGTHGAQIVFYTLREKEDEATGAVEKIPVLRSYHVFNIEQCEGLPARLYSQVVLPVDFPAVQELLARVGAHVVHTGNEACFIPSLDRIHIPLPEQFSSPEHYFATLLHEHIHWSGDKKRLARDFGKRFGDHAYAAEELVAELGAAFLCAHFGIPGELRHAGYLQHWVSLMKEDKRAIFTAATQAQQASEYLLTLPVLPATEAAV